MRYIIFAVLLFLALAAPALAQEPEPEGYNFEIIDYSAAQTEQLNINLTEPGTINRIGSIAITLMALVSENILLSSLVIVVLVSLAVVFMMTVIANKKIDADISTMTTDYELSDSLAEITQSAPIRASAVRDMKRLNYQIANKQKKYQDAGKAIGHFKGTTKQYRKWK